ncbi:MAG: hypothetical protein LBG82_02675 [Clostridiales Family XIII bacterium]|nr:hypothetical protein [Clostridiales Family XIII bacterium]
MSNSVNGMTGGISGMPAVDGGGKPSGVAAAFGKLTKREQGLIYALIVLGVACALVFLLFMPGLERLERLEKEAAAAEDQKKEYVSTIAEGLPMEQAIAEANALHDEAKGKLFPQMMPEALDAMVTKYLVGSGFDPQTLSMSELSPETIAMFNPPQGADGQPAGTGTEGQEAQPASEIGAASAEMQGGAEGGQAEADGSGESEIAPVEVPEASGTDGPIYSYSVNVTATGGWNNLYKLLKQIAATDGAEVTQYSYNGGSDPKSSGSFTMTIKFYVYKQGQDTESQ